MTKRRVKKRGLRSLHAPSARARAARQTAVVPKGKSLQTELSSGETMTLIVSADGRLKILKD